MAENTVNDEENLNSQSSQLEEEDLQTLEADSERLLMYIPRSMAGGEVHVSLRLFNQLCQTVSLAIALLISSLNNLC